VGKPYTPETCAQSCKSANSGYKNFVLAGGDSNCMCFLQCSKGPWTNHKAYMIVDPSWSGTLHPTTTDPYGSCSQDQPSTNCGGPYCQWLTVGKPYTPETCAQSCKSANSEYQYFVLAGGDSNCMCFVHCSKGPWSNHKAYKIVDMAAPVWSGTLYPTTTDPYGSCSQDQPSTNCGGQYCQWLTVGKPYTPETCAQSCKSANSGYKNFVLAGGDSNCMCFLQCSKGPWTNHKAYMIVDPSWSGTLHPTTTDPYGSCSQDQPSTNCGGPYCQWLTVGKPYTPETCAQSCKSANSEYQYFVLAGGDSNCMCFVHCSKGPWTNHKAYKIV